MQLSYPVGQYKNCVAQAFCELLIGIQYASELPNTDRMVKFLSRLKEAQFDGGDPIPGLTTTDLCRTGLPLNWCYIQYNRGPLQPVEEDEFRVDHVRTISTNKATFSQEDWGFGRADIKCWLVGNNGDATEAAEALYYMHLYRIKSVDYLYLGIPWRSRIVHDPLQTFEPLGLAEFGTGFTITWQAQIFVPMLRRQVEGFTVQTTCNEIFDATLSIDIRKYVGIATPLDFDESKAVPADLSYRSEYNPATDTVETEEIHGRCDEP
jgi:hypothetical protein